MGVNQLWTILQPATYALPLGAIASQRVVVDLSCWIVECSGSRLPGVHARWQPHLHLQGLFHRLRVLLALNCTVACVTDGDFDQLKRPTVTARLQGPLSQLQKDKAAAKRYAGGAAAKRPQHSHFGRKVQEAVRLCEALGIPCIRSPVDAEAQCAVLNAAGLFDACITTDSDAFLFGANKVYRSFKLDGQSGCDGVVEVCTRGAFQQKLGFGRNSLIALGVFLGSDYHGGVKGVGVQKATRLITQLGEAEVLDTILTEGVQAILNEAQPKSSKARAGRAKEKAEQSEGPSQIDPAAIAAVIKAYLEPQVHAPDSDTITRALASSRELQLDSLVDLMQQYLDWDPDKTKSFILPKLAERALRQRAAQPQRSLSAAEQTALPRPLQYRLKQILKARTVKHVRSYDVSWEGSPPLADTTVPADLLEKAYPDVVLSFKDAEAAEKRCRKKPTGPKQTAEARGASHKRSGREHSAVLQPLPENVSPDVVQSEDSCLDMASLQLTERPSNQAVSLAVATDTRGKVWENSCLVDLDGSNLSDEELEWDIPWRGLREGESRATSSGRTVCGESMVSQVGDDREGQTSKERGTTSHSGTAGAKSTGRGSSRAGIEKFAKPGGSRTAAEFCQWSDDERIAGRGAPKGVGCGRKERGEGTHVIDLDSDEEESDGARSESQTLTEEEGQPTHAKSNGESRRPSASPGSTGGPGSLRSIIASINLNPRKPAPTLSTH